MSEPKENKEECEGGMCPINIQGKVIHSTTCPLSAPQTPDSMGSDWEIAFDVEFGKLTLGTLSGDEKSPVFVNNDLEIPRLKNFIKREIFLAHSSGRREGIAIGRKIFVEEVDWAEWGVDMEGAQERYDEAVKSLEQ